MINEEDIRILGYNRYSNMKGNLTCRQHPRYPDLDGQISYLESVMYQLFKKKEVLRNHAYIPT